MGEGDILGQKGRDGIEVRAVEGAQELVLEVDGLLGGDGGRRGLRRRLVRRKVSAAAASAAGNRMSNLAIEFPPFGPFRLALNYGDNALNAQG